MGNREGLLVKTERREKIAFSVLRRKSARYARRPVSVLGARIVLRTRLCPYTYFDRGLDQQKLTFLG